jgi:hypothetical protein
LVNRSTFSQANFARNNPWAKKNIH